MGFNKSILFILLALFSAGNAYAEVGLESDTMAFLNRGFHGSAWYGVNGKRVRLVYAKATFPEFLNPAGFSGLTSTFKEIEFDFFFGKQKHLFRGFWFAIGGGQTEMSIASQATGATAHISVNDVHSGIGYAIPVGSGLSINPWIGVDIHLNALDNVPVGAETWNPRKTDIVGGVKLGIDF